MGKPTLDEVGFFGILEARGIHVDAAKRARIQEKLEEIRSYKPRVGIFGKAGAGKSSLCNALFGKDVCEISHVEACTRNPQEVLAQLGSDGITLVDVPGLAESRERDDEYRALYRALLPELDVVLWLLKADDRAYGPDGEYYRELVSPHVGQGKPCLLVLTQSEKVEPSRDWDDKQHRPGPKQQESLASKRQKVAVAFGVAESKVVEISAHEKWNLVRLIDEIVMALPPEKRPTFVHDVSDDYVSASTIEIVEKSLLQSAWDTVTESFEGMKGQLSNVSTADVAKATITALRLWWRI